MEKACLIEDACEMYHWTTMQPINNGEQPHTIALPNNIIDDKNRTILHYASFNNYYRTAEILLQNQNNDVNILDKYLCRPLHYAIQSKSYNIIQLLLEHNPSFAPSDIEQENKLTRKFICNIVMNSLLDAKPELTHRLVTIHQTTRPHFKPIAKFHVDADTESVLSSLHRRINHEDIDDKISLQQNKSPTAINDRMSHPNKPHRLLSTTLAIIKAQDIEMVTIKTTGIKK